MEEVPSLEMDDQQEQQQFFKTDVFPKHDYGVGIQSKEETLTAAQEHVKESEDELEKLVSDNFHTISFMERMTQFDSAQDFQMKKVLNAFVNFCVPVLLM